MVPQIFQEAPGRPSEQNKPEKVNNIPRVEVELPLGVGLESSSETEYEENSSEDENIVGPENPDYGYDDDYIGDDLFTLYTRRDIYFLLAENFC